MSEHYIQIIGIIAGICTSISLLPQFIKLVKTKKSQDLSLFYLSILFIGVALWIWYGTLRNDVPIVATNSFSLLLNALTLYLGIKYKRNKDT